jgi:flagellar biosynthesis protein FlhF
MNPYARVASKPSAQSKSEAFALFAPDVYAEDGDSRKRGEMDGIGDELLRLRAELRGEARALRSLLARSRVPAELLAEIATLRAAVEELLAARKAKRGDSIGAAIGARGIEGPAAAALTRLAKGKRGTPQRCLRDALRSFVRTAPWPPALAQRGGRVLVGLVGPAGVGKTTTAAKLAARARMANKAVALVSCDGFRVGAIDQLGRYAELMGASFHSASSQEDLVDVLSREKADVVVVDTSGRPVAPTATEAVLGAPEIRREAARIFDAIEVLLCVPASLRAADAARVNQQFAVVQPTALAVTKLDETDAPAGIAHAAFATRLPITTTCSGQRVPEDIAPATDDALAEQLFPESSEATHEAEAR